MAGKRLKIIAYCTKCNEVLMASNELSKKKLIKSWDSAVIQAVSIPCKHCGFKFPNFNIELKVKDCVTGIERDPKDYITSKIHVDNFLSFVAKKSIEELKIEEPTDTDVQKTLKSFGDESVSKKEKLRRALELRRKYYNS